MLQEYRITFGIEENRHGHVMAPDYVGMKLSVFRRSLLRRFGGYGEYNLQGGWMDSAGRTVVESGKCFSIFYDTASHEIGPIRETAIEIGRLLNQHTVCLIKPTGEVCMIEIAE